MNLGLSNIQIRKILDSIYDGETETFFYIMQIQSFYCKKQNKERELRVYLWFIKNKVTGKKFIEFFRRAGFLEGLNHVVNRLDGRKHHSNIMKINEAY